MPHHTKFSSLLQLVVLYPVNLMHIPETLQNLLLKIHINIHKLINIHECINLPDKVNIH